MISPSWVAVLAVAVSAQGAGGAGNDCKKEDVPVVTADAAGVAFLQVPHGKDETVRIASVEQRWALAAPLGIVERDGWIELGAPASAEACARAPSSPVPERDLPSHAWREAMKYTVALEACPRSACAPGVTLVAAGKPARAAAQPTACRPAGKFLVDVPKLELATPDAFVLSCETDWRGHLHECRRDLGAVDKATARPVWPLQISPHWPRRDDLGAPAGELRCDARGVCRAVEFAPGITKGKLAVAAARLNAVALVPFEVHARLPQAWLFVLMVGGIVAGWGVRVGLAKAIEGYETVAAARRLADELRATPEHRNDAGFRDALKSSLDTLDAARTTAEAKQAVEAAKKALEAERAARATRKAALETAFRGYHDVLDLEWLVPAGVRDAIASLSGRLETAEAAATRADLATATAIEKRLHGYGAELQDAVQAWLDRGEPRTIDVSGVPVPPDAIAAFDAARRAIPTRRPHPDAVGLLNAVHLAVAGGLDAFAAAVESIRSMVAEAARALPPDDAASLLRALEAFERAWARSPDDLATRAALLAGDGARLAERAGSAPGVRNVAPAAGPSTILPPAQREWRGLAALIAPDRPLDLRTAEQRAQGWRLAQRALAVGITVLAGYGLFAPKFYGTFTDIAALVAWGAAANLTVDKALELLGQLKRA